MRILTKTVAASLGLILLCTHVGCTSSVVPEEELHTMVAVLDSNVTSVGTELFIQAGATDVREFLFLNAIGFRGVNADVYEGISGVLEVEDFGEERDPSVSVFLTLKSDVTERDIEFVKAGGGVTLGALPQRPRVLPMVIELSKTGFIESWSRVQTAELVLDDFVPGG